MNEPSPARRSLHGRVASFTRFDEGLARRIYAGADFFLMPSLYEPCGLGQMIAQRYGTPPIVRSTGGLADTVEDGKTGFVFDEPSVAALVDAFTRASRVWRARGWVSLQRRCMRLDWSWARSAERYEHVDACATGRLPG
jgi:starch synthase